MIFTLIWKLRWYETCIITWNGQWAALLYASWTTEVFLQLVSIHSLTKKCILMYYNYYYYYNSDFCRAFQDTRGRFAEKTKWTLIIIKVIIIIVEEACFLKISRGWGQPLESFVPHKCSVLCGRWRMDECWRIWTSRTVCTAGGGRTATEEPGHFACEKKDHVGEAWFNREQMEIDK